MDEMKKNLMPDGRNEKKLMPDGQNKIFDAIWTK